MIEAVIRSVDQQEKKLIINLKISAGLEYFQGHFPDRPVLPGVVQTHWAIQYGIRYLGLPGRIKKLEVIKFKHLIRPNMEIALKLELKPNGKLSFSYSHEGHVMSSGRIVYPEPR